MFFAVNLKPHTNLCKHHNVHKWCICCTMGYLEFRKIKLTFIHCAVETFITLFVKATQEGIEAAKGCLAGKLSYSLHLFT